MVQPVSPNLPAVHNRTAAQQTVVAQPGQSLGDVARQHGVTTGALLDANPQLGVSVRLNPGQELMLPQTPAPQTLAPQTPAPETPALQPTLGGPAPAANPGGRTPPRAANGHGNPGGLRPPGGGAAPPGTEPTVHITANSPPFEPGGPTSPGGPSAPSPTPGNPTPGNPTPGHPTPGRPVPAGPPAGAPGPAGGAPILPAPPSLPPGGISAAPGSHAPLPGGIDPGAVQAGAVLRAAPAPQGPPFNPNSPTVPTLPAPPAPPPGTPAPTPATTQTAPQAPAAPHPPAPPGQTHPPPGPAAPPAGPLEAADARSFGASLQRAVQGLAERQPAALKALLRQVLGGTLDPSAQARLLRAMARGQLPLPAKALFAAPSALLGRAAAYSASGGGALHLHPALQASPSGLRAVYLHTAAHHIGRALGVAQAADPGTRQLIQGIARGAAMAVRDPGPAVQVHAATLLGRAQPEIAPTGTLAWLARAGTASRPEVFVDYAIASLLGLPTGAWTQSAGLLGALAEASADAQQRGLEGLRQAIDDIRELIQELARRGIPGAVRLLVSLTTARDGLLAAVEQGELGRARAALGAALGYLREGQMAARWIAEGAEIGHFSRPVATRGGTLTTEIDVVAQRDGEVLFGTVHAGSRAMIEPSTPWWRKFVEQTDEMLRAAGTETARLRFFTDGVSEQARRFLESRQIEVVVHDGGDLGLQAA